MRSIIRFVLASAAALSLTACSDRNSPVEPGQSARPSTNLFPTFGGTRLGPDDFSAIAAGGDFTCARKMNGNVYCWGLDDRYQVGSSSSTMCSSNYTCAPKPRQVFKSAGVPLLVAQMDAGAAHACAIESNTTTAWCWGDGNSGQVGYMNGYYGYFGPSAVTGGLPFYTISAGGNSTCAITTSYAVYCWGTIVGQASAPALYDNNPAYRFSQVTVGDVHVCGLDVLTMYGVPRCKGNNLSGQGGQTASAQIDFSQATTFGSQVGGVSTEGYFTCVNQVAGTMLTVQCVGLNDYGELGNGQSGLSTSTGTAQTVGNGTISLYNVTTGTVHACALDMNKAAYCWGNGYWGQLGNGAQAVYSSPQLVGGGHTYRALAAGHQHTCGIGTDNVIYCWGSNQFGQLGTNNPYGGLVTQPTALAAIP